MLYKPLPMDWVNWNPAKVSYEAYSKIVKPDPPLTNEEKTNNALAALLEYSFWKNDIPVKFLNLVETIYPEKYKEVIRLDDRANKIKSHELRRMVLMKAGNMLAELIGMDGPVL